jgi:hypothetical protein
MRHGCELQLQFMQKDFAKENPPRVIYGQPGSGKSTTAFIYCLSESVHRQKIVLWVHLNMSNPQDLSFVVMGSSELRGGKFGDLESLIRFIDSPWGFEDTSSPRILVIDGYISSEILIKLRYKVGAWRMRNINLGTVFYVSPLTKAPEIVQKEHKGIIVPEKFLQLSWSLDEYLSALEDIRFRQDVADVLKPIDSAAQLKSKAEVVSALRNKFFYAGGCASDMFQFSTRAVVEKQTDFSHYVLSDIKSVVEILRGDSSIDPNHRLVSILPDGNREPMSQFLKKQISRKLRNDGLLKILDEIVGNPALTKWVFEESFFYMIRAASSGTIFLKQKKKKDFAIDVGNKTKADDVFDPEDPQSCSCPLNEWLRPLKFDQCGFDGLFLKKIRRGVSAIFAQCTVGAARSGWRGDCLKLVRKLKEALKHEILEIHFHFIVPEENLSQFEPTDLAYPKEELLLHFPDPKILGLTGWP